MDILKKYKVYIILLMVFVIGIFAQFLTNSFNDSFDCATSPYSELKKKYCVRAWNEGGYVIGGERNFVTEPAYLIIPVFTHMGILQEIDVDMGAFIWGEVYTYAYSNDVTWLRIIQFLNFLYWIGLFFLFGWLWNKKLWGKFIVVTYLAFMFIMPVLFFVYIFLGNIYVLLLYDR